MWYLVVFFFKPKPADEIRISDWSSDVCSSDLTHTKVVAVTVLTSLDAPDLDDIGVGGTPHDQVVRLAALARQAGLDGIVCSGQEVKTARRAWPGGYLDRNSVGWGKCGYGCVDLGGRGDINKKRR